MLSLSSSALCCSVILCFCLQCSSSSVCYSSPQCCLLFTNCVTTSHTFHPAQTEDSFGQRVYLFIRCYAMQFNSSFNLKVDSLPRPIPPWDVLQAWLLSHGKTHNSKVLDCSSSWAAARCYNKTRLQSGRKEEPFPWRSHIYPLLWIAHPTLQYDFLATAGGNLLNWCFVFSVRHLSCKEENLWAALWLFLTIKVLNTEV